MLLLLHMVLHLLLVSIAVFAASIVAARGRCCMWCCCCMGCCCCCKCCCCCCLCCRWYDLWSCVVARHSDTWCGHYQHSTCRTHNTQLYMHTHSTMLRNTQVLVWSLDTANPSVRCLVCCCYITITSFLTKSMSCTQYRVFLGRAAITNLCPGGFFCQFLDTSASRTLVLPRLLAGSNALCSSPKPSHLITYSILRCLPRFYSVVNTSCTVYSHSTSRRSGIGGVCKDDYCYMFAASQHARQGVSRVQLVCYFTYAVSNSEWSYLSGPQFRCPICFDLQFFVDSESWSPIPCCWTDAASHSIVSVFTHTFLCTCS